MYKSITTKLFLKSMISLLVPVVQVHHLDLLWYAHTPLTKVTSTAATLAQYGDLDGSSQLPDCALVIDTGFSFTHVVPMMAGQVMWGSVRRYAFPNLSDGARTQVSFTQH